MAQQQKVQLVKDLYGDIVSVTTGHRKNHRLVLADVYQMTLSAGGFFPRKPRSLSSVMPANLRRKVDNSCSLCINQSKMDEYIEDAKNTLINYNAQLKFWLEDNEVLFDSEGNAVLANVKDLKPTLKIKTK